MTSKDHPVQPPVEIQSLESRRGQTPPGTQVWPNLAPLQKLLKGRNLTIPSQNHLNYSETLPSCMNPTTDFIFPLKNPFLAHAGGQWISAWCWQITQMGWKPSSSNQGGEVPWRAFFQTNVDASHASWGYFHFPSAPSIWGGHHTVSTQPQEAAGLDPFPPSVHSFPCTFLLHVAQQFQPADFLRVYFP